MKTDVNKRKMNPSALKYAAMLGIMLLTGAMNAQDNLETKTLLRPDVTISEMWIPEIKMNSIQGDFGTLVGFYGGALFNRNLLLGVAGGVNLSHPRVNYGYFGGIIQVIFHPENMVHFSGQVLLAWGTTKDYESPKKGLMDNFWNISGEDFYITEPGVNVEINLKDNLTLVTGVSYRFSFRLDDQSESVRYTHVTNRDMRGLNFNIGVKFGKKIKYDIHE